jgi:putative aldouronate transport system substrate-binding protein
MSKQLKRITSVILASMMVAALFAGCGTKETKSTEASTNAQLTTTEKKALKKVKLDIVLPGEPQPAQDEISKALEEATAADGLNIDLVITAYRGVIIVQR